VFDRVTEEITLPKFKRIGWR